MLMYVDAIVIDDMPLSFVQQTRPLHLPVGGGATLGVFFWLAWNAFLVQFPI